MVPTSPSIFTANADGMGVPAANSILVLPDFTQVVELVFDPLLPLGQRVPLPISLGDEDDLLFLSLFMTGIRAAIPGSPLSKGAPPRSLQPWADRR